MKLAIGADHGGFQLKIFLLEKLQEKGFTVIDCGIYEAAAADYPDIAAAVCYKIQNGEAERGLLICGTGIGISIAANKHKGIRAALCSEAYSAAKAIEHNNANVLALGGRTVGPELAWSITESFLGATFEGGRHERRVAKIMAIEQEGSGRV